MQSRSTCYRYAIAELTRLLERIGVSVSSSVESPLQRHFFLQMSNPDSHNIDRPPTPDEVFSDGYVVQISADGITISAKLAKGILNGVYDIAERLGFLFLLPGNEGEWPPVKKGDFSLPITREVINPRFKYRGIWGCGRLDYTVEEWLRFYAKLRFNALSHLKEDLPLAKELGLRLEFGGHRLSRLLPRELLEEKPELFRMSQPEDFFGRRCSDANMCITNPWTKKIIKDNFRQELNESKGIYALHFWPDDLPAGGWCLCPSCRALSPSDQAMLAMRHLAEVIAEEESLARLAFLAYHDTIAPPKNILPPAEAFLLFAPRERCYAHTLDNPSCKRNAFYLKALRQLALTFDGIGDAHTFEYYFDQCLFRGIYPFLPEVILQDVRTYEENGIETNLSLQTSGPAIAPEFNMLVFARAQWSKGLTADDFISDIAAQICPDDPKPWRLYLTRRKAVFSKAMRMCEYDFDLYMDYRWLPESSIPFAAEMAQTYHDAACELALAADELASAKGPSAAGRTGVLSGKEAARARFEAAELEVMSLQQKAMNHICAYHQTGETESLEEGIRFLKKTLHQMEETHDKARKAKLPEDSYYYALNTEWLKKEFEKKIAKCSAALKLS